MNKEQLIEKGLTEEQATEVLKLHKQEIDEGYVTKVRMNDLNEANKKLQEQINERDSQIKELKKVDAQDLQKKIEELEATNKSAKEKYEADLKQRDLNYALSSALKEAGSKNDVAVKALLQDFLKDAKTEGEADSFVIKGLKEEIERLQKDESSSFMFNVKTEPTTVLNGAKPTEGAEKPTTKTLKDMSYEERVAYFEANPNTEI